MFFDTFRGFIHFTFFFMFVNTAESLYLVNYDDISTNETLFELYTNILIIYMVWAFKGDFHYGDRIPTQL